MEDVKVIQVRNVASGQMSFDGDREMARANPRREQIVVQGLPWYAELVRQGCVWRSLNTTATAALVTTTVPTTTMNGGLWNGEPSGGKSYILLQTGVMTVASSTAAAYFTIYGSLQKLLTTTVTATAETNVIFSHNGKASYQGNARLNQGSAAAVADGWIPLINTTTTALTANSGYGINVDLNGLYILPPGGWFCLAVVATSATATVRPFFVWAEVQLPINL